MAISFSRPDPSSPAAVADASFGTSRRGFDQQEVRDFLRMVAAELARLQERERFLERELRAGTATPTIDEDMVTRLLGEEAARILQTARESAAQIKAKAEDGAARLLREATDDANRQRQEAELEAARRRADAAADAEAELAMAKQQGREMVEEARAYRERVLGELARRRDLARQQIEQLIHGRDRLLQAFERARLVAVDVVGELAPLSEPDEYVDLTPTTGPVPLTVPAARLGDASAVGETALPGETADHEPPYDGTADELPGDDPSPPAFVAAGDDGGTETAASGPDTSATDTPEADTPEAGEPEPDTTVVAFPAPAVDTAPAAPDTTAAPAADEIDDDDVTATDVDDLFARLRAGRPPAAPAGGETATDTDTDTGTATAGGDTPEDAADSTDAEGEEESPFRARDAALVPLITAAARKLKRVLADEQNEVLDALRRKEPVRTLDVLVPWESEQSDRYADGITKELVAAAEAGAVSVAGTTALDLGPTGTLAPSRQALADHLVVPLRERLFRCVDDGDGDNDVIARRVRAVYREWKTQRIDEHLDDLFRTAYARAAYESLGPGRLVRWNVDPEGPASPDCEDNSLADAVITGDAFPTGHTCPPAHPGCRCLLTTVEG